MNLQSVKQLAILGLASLVISCGGGDGAVPTPPPVIPEGDITGVVMVGPVSNATITAYGINPDDGKINTETPLYVGTNDTDGDGRFSFPLKASSKTAILICATEGTYTEPASVRGSSGADKKMGTDKLCAMSIYDPEDAKNKIKTTVNITFYTHLAYGSFRNKMAHKTGKGIVLDKIVPADPNVPGSQPKLISGTLNVSNQEVSEWLNIRSVVTVTPLEINRSVNISDRMTEGHAYGFAILGISSVADWLVTKGQEEGTFKGISSVLLAQKAYDDIKGTRGFLDGRGSGSDIVFGSTILDQHIYRHHLGLRILALSENSDINKTGLKSTQVSTLVNQIITHTTSVFDPELSPENFDKVKPSFSHQAGLEKTASTLVKGPINFGLTVVDVSGINSVVLTIYNGKTGNTDVLKEVNYEPQSGNKALYVWKIPTKGVIPDGFYNIEVVATNNKDKPATYPVSNIQIANSDLVIDITKPFPPKAGNPKNALSGKVTFSAIITDSFPNSEVVFDFVDAATTLKTVAKANAILPLLPAPITKSTTTANSAATYEVFEYNTALAADGEYKFRVKLVSNRNADGTINTGTTRTLYALLPFAIDNFAPQGTLNTGANFKVTNDGNFTVSGIVEDKPDSTAIAQFASGIAPRGVSIQVTTESKATFTGDYKGTLGTISGLLQTEGWHDLLFMADDIAGNHLHANSIKYAYDKTPAKPGVNITKGSPANTWVKALTISGTATDTVGVFSVYANIDGQGVNTQYEKLANKPDLGDTKLTYSFPFKNLPEGQRNIDIVAVDKSAKIENATSFRNIGIDRTQPNIQISPASLTVPQGATGVPADITPGKTVIPQPDSANFALTMIVDDPGYVKGSSTNIGSGLRAASYTVTGATEVGGHLPFTLSTGEVTNVLGKTYKFTLKHNIPKRVIHTGSIRRETRWDVTASCKSVGVTTKYGILPLTGVPAANVPGGAVGAVVYKSNTAGTIAPGTRSATVSYCYTTTSTSFSGNIAGSTTYTYYVADVIYNWKEILPKSFVIDKVVLTLPAKTLVTKGELTVNAEDLTVPTGTTWTKSYCMKADVTNTIDTTTQRYKVSTRTVPENTVLIGANPDPFLVSIATTGLAAVPTTGAKPTTVTACGITVDPIPLATTGKATATPVPCIIATAVTNNVSLVDNNLTGVALNPSPASKIKDNFAVVYTADPTLCPK